MTRSGVTQPIVIGGEPGRRGDIPSHSVGTVFIRREEAEIIAKIGAEYAGKESKIMRDYRNGRSFAEGAQYEACSKAMRDRGRTRAD